MKAIEFWARELADVNGHMDQHAAMVYAYEQGAKKIKEHAGQLLITLGVPKAENLGILIRGIGTAAVDPETGKIYKDDE